MFKLDSFVQRVSKSIFRHDNFVANSSLLIDKSCLTLVAEAATAKHTTCIFHMASKLLMADDLLWADTR